MDYYSGLFIPQKQTLARGKLHCTRILTNSPCISKDLASTSQDDPCGESPRSLPNANEELCYDDTAEEADENNAGC